MLLPVAISIALFLSVAPGFWVAAWLPRGEADGATRLAIAAAFSPSIVSLWMFGSAMWGWDPFACALAAAATGVAAIFLTRRFGERLPGTPAKRWAAAAVAVGLPSLWLAAHWGTDPDFRLFGRHNLMHADMVYQLVRAPWPPESSELAGTPMAYGWFGHGFHAATGLLADRPPTWLFPWHNLVALGATSLLLARCARSLGASTPAAALAGALALLTGNFTFDPAFWMAAPEDPSKVLATATKFLFLDLMPASFPLLGVFLWASVRQTRSATLVGAVAALALGATYIAALPAALSIAAGLGLAHGLTERRVTGIPHSLIALFLAAAAATALATWWTPSGPVAPGVALSPAIAWQEKGLDLLGGFAPWWLLGLPALWVARQSDRPALAGLQLAALVLALAYPALLVRNLEYKFVMYARLLIAPALAISCFAIPAVRRGAWASAVIVALVVGAAALPRGLDRIEQAHLESAVPVGESAFHLTLADGRSEGWLQALAATEADTVLVVRRCTVMLGAFANRSLYAPCAADGRDIAGYTLWVPANLYIFRGHPQQLLAERNAQVGSLFRATTPTPFWDALGEVRALGRPVALLLSADDALRPRWMRDAGIGEERYADGVQRLWWIPASEN